MTEIIQKGAESHCTGGPGARRGPQRYGRWPSCVVALPSPAYALFVDGCIYLVEISREAEPSANDERFVASWTNPELTTEHRRSDWLTCRAVTVCRFA